MSQIVAQKFEPSLTLKTGIVALGSEDSKTSYLHRFNHGINFAGGIGIEVALNKRESLALSMHLQYAYVKQKKSRTDISAIFNTTDQRESRETKLFVNHFLQLPINLHWKKGKFSVSGGISPTLNLKSKIKFKFRSRRLDPTQDWQRSEYQIESGSSKVRSGIEDGFERYIESPITFQLQLGINYHFNKWAVGIEGTRFPKNNFLVNEVEGYDFGIWVEKIQYARNMGRFVLRRFL